MVLHTFGQASKAGIREKVEVVDWNSITTPESTEVTRIVDWNSKLYAAIDGKLYEYNSVTESLDLKVNRYSSFDNIVMLFDNVVYSPRLYGIHRYSNNGYHLYWTGAGNSWTYRGRISTFGYSEIDNRMIDLIPDPNGYYWAHGGRAIYATNNLDTTWFGRGTNSGIVFEWCLLEDTPYDWYYYHPYGDSRIYYRQKRFSGTFSSIATGFNDVWCTFNLDGTIRYLRNNGYIYSYIASIVDSSPPSDIAASGRKHSYTDGSTLWVISHVKTGLWTWDTSNGWTEIIADKGDPNKYKTSIWKFDNRIWCGCADGSVEYYIIS